jgi:hypothetical protein
MYWLIDDTETSISLEEAALLLAAMAMRQESANVRRRFPSASGVELLLLTISMPTLRWLINEAFSGKLGIYDLALIPLIPYEQKIVDKIKTEINIVNALTKSRLRLNETADVEPSLKNAQNLLASLESQEKCGATRSKGIEKKRRDRAAFLYVAVERGSGAPDLFYAVSDSFESFVNCEADKLNALHGYFARVKSILPIVNNDLAEKLGNVWSQLDPVPLNPLQPVDLEDLDTAGIGKKLRRSAQETKAASRQRPRSK